MKKPSMYEGLRDVMSKMDAPGATAFFPICPLLRVYDPKGIAGVMHKIQVYAYAYGLKQSPRWHTEVHIVNRRANPGAFLVIKRSWTSTI